MKPPVTAQLVWERDLVFKGRSGQASIVLDGDSAAGPSPVQTLVFALAGCMAMDVVHVLKKGRHPLQALTVSLTATRAQADPHRLLTAELQFAVTGAVPEAAVQHAIDLSREKYCSVWHSLRQDIALTTRVSITASV
ncbi:MAG TPA: OsmC family protein [Vicinamibacterales bacterium]|nr:OsmC family protein [Vicinamibacterales bacterium]